MGAMGKSKPLPKLSEELAAEGASTIGISELLANEAEIIRLYHELAKRHDSLVEQIQSQLLK